MIWPYWGDTIRATPTYHRAPGIPSKLSFLNFSKQETSAELLISSEKKCGVEPGFISLHWNTEEWTYIHTNILKYFTDKKRLSPIEALEEMKGLSKPALEALELLYSDGLRGHHLRDWPHVFNDTRRQALIELMIMKKLPVEDAVQTLKSMPEEEMNGLANQCLYN